MNDKLIFSDIHFLLNQIKTKAKSPVDIVGKYLTRIKELNPVLNAYITIMEDQAIAEALSSQEHLLSEKPMGPLQGIPIGIKDQVHTRGIKTTSASLIRSEFVPSEDATIVSRLKSAGAIVVGKLNMTEFAMGDPITSYYGMTFNPWDTTRDPGTSSTGAGAATASGMCAAAIGEDTGGSIRGPAANCGIVGIRPSWGLVSRNGLDGAAWSLDTLGPLTRTVKDSALILSIIAGEDPLDTYTSPRPVPKYSEKLNSDIKGLKIAVLHEFIDGPNCLLDPDIKTSMQEAISVFKSLGAQVDTISIPITSDAGAVSRTISFVDRVSLNPQWVRERPGDFHHNTRVSFLTGELIPAQIYYKAQKLRTQIRSEVLNAFRQYDIIMMPTDETVAGVIDETPGLKNLDNAKTSLRKSMYRGLFSLVSGPAISIPCGFKIIGSKSIPIGLQLAGKPFNEQTVFNCAYAFEQATPWHNEHPPI